MEAGGGGTLFLDEVDDIPLAMQVKLLRLLETGTYRRVGSTEQRPADIRVVLATHRDLEQMLSAGMFREDLYYRLSTFPIHLPSLRERRDDIALLAKALLARVAPEREVVLGESALGVLQAQNYPGNVREWRNLQKHPALLCDGDTLEDNHVLQALRSGLRCRSVSAPSQETAADVLEWPLEHEAGATLGVLKSLEHVALKQLASAHHGNRSELAQKLGIRERSLYRKLKDLGP